MSGTQQLLAAPGWSQTWCLTSSPPPHPHWTLEMKAAAGLPLLHVTRRLLFLTPPVTVAASERSLSKLKLIKNHLIVDEFAERKAVAGMCIL